MQQQRQLRRDANRPSSSILSSTTQILACLFLVVISGMIGTAAWLATTLDEMTLEEEGQQQQQQAQQAQQAEGEEQNNNVAEANNNNMRRQTLDGQVQHQSQRAASSSSVCPYQTLNDLTPEERFPKASASRHMITPPSGGKVHLVCCETTKGPWNIVVHEIWAPLGAARFLEMVQTGYFNHGVPLMRCVRQFLCQFGLNGRYSRQFQSSLKDDPNWLPQGPTHRQNDLNVKRFQRGYFAYAGAGPNSRSNQLFVALADNGPLAGGSPWEVPWGELVGSHSFQTLKQIYTGYGDKGPKQSWLHQHDSSDQQLRQDFPLLDYVKSCEVVDSSNDDVKQER